MVFTRDRPFQEDHCKGSHNMQCICLHRVHNTENGSQCDVATFTGEQTLQCIHNIYFSRHWSLDGIDLYLASDLSFKLLNTKKLRLLQRAQFFNPLTGWVTSHPCHPLNPPLIEGFKEVDGSSSCEFTIIKGQQTN